MDNTNKKEKINQFDKDKEKDSEANLISYKNSLNPTEGPLNTDYELSEPQSLGIYRGRIARQVTINAHPSRDNKFFKVIIPYSFDQKKYTINKKEIEFYENKKYLFEKLKYFNNIETFDIEKDFNPKHLQKVCLYVPFFLICIIVIYLAIITSALFSFNIMVMFTLGTWIRKGYNSLQMFKFILLEKFKIKEIHKLLKEENDTRFCINHKLKWILGQSGYWLEVQKLIE
jgi:hypothetical protein